MVKNSERVKEATKCAKCGSSKPVGKPCPGCGDGS
jgi:hypothetical protein